jgi:hypothetical protein
MKRKGRVIEREIQECLERSNMQLNRLRSIQTATKKRRALKWAASNPGSRSRCNERKELHEHSPLGAASSARPSSDYGTAMPSALHHRRWS